MKKIKSALMVMLSFFVVLCASACGYESPTQVTYNLKSKWDDYGNNIKSRKLEWDATLETWTLGELGRRKYTQGGIWVGCTCLLTESL